MLAGRRVLLGVTGGIAAYKAAILARLMVAEGAEVTTVLTEGATRFVGADTFAALTDRRAYTSLWESPGEVIHVRLAHDADVAVVAPCTANFMAKLANGLADDLLSAVLLEYPGQLVLAPAMHTGMWNAPATRQNASALASRGVLFVGPVEGALAHGDEGMGRLAEPEEILAAVASALGPRDLDGRRLLVTAGPTHEPLDPVRFLGNRSSGKMGVAVAVEALRRGASVTLVLGPGTVTPPSGADVIRVQTAEEMRKEVLSHVQDADAVVMAAAVADFKPKAPSETKLKKDQGVPDVVLEPTVDILQELRQLKGSRIVVGFAAETDDVEAAGRAKLEAKGLDLLVANRVGAEGTGFGSDTNEAAILSARGGGEPLRTWTKAELAAALCDRIAASLAS